MNKSLLGIAVFARIPEITGKTRLADTWNKKATDEFYLHCLKCAAQWLHNGKHLATGYWALTGEGPRDHDYWKNDLILEQSGNSLGERMAHISDQLSQRHDYWCLVGSDIPQMPALDALFLHEKIEKSDIIFGPSLDGGFWLVGGKKRLPSTVWTTTPYSRQDTLQKMIASLEKIIPDCIIDLSVPTLGDIDTFDELKHLLDVFTKSQSPLSQAQKDLKNWLIEQLPFRAQQWSI